MRIITTIFAMAITTIASAQVVSPNGKVEWREKGKGFAVVYHDGNNECEVLDITEIHKEVFAFIFLRDNAFRKRTVTTVNINEKKFAFFEKRT